MKVKGVEIEIDGDANVEVKGDKVIIHAQPALVPMYPFYPAYPYPPVYYTNPRWEITCSGPGTYVPGGTNYVAAVIQGSADLVSWSQ